MSPTATISNPMSVTSLSPDSVVSNLENALMQNIGQDMQGGQSVNGGNVQQEMQLLTELLNQSNSSENDSSQRTNSDTSANDSRPTNNAGPTNNGGLNKAESKLDNILERDVTNRLQNGQDPNNNQLLGQEMNVLIQLLGPSA
ncbi:MAG: hypothetical protein JO033_12420 [Acidobacteriaceae bacterium]|nr:hypothetical protein [Acidobacteriaceae bacterium]MBV9498304.1 hypothetical protein [Acidobacteriaceae bacterium]